MKTWNGDLRLGGLRRFAIAISVLNIFGHTLLGFEQSWLHPFASLATAYSTELGLEWLESRSQGRAPRYQGGFRKLVDFLLSAHISGLAVAMLTFPDGNYAPTMFAAAVAIASKFFFRAPVEGRSRHFLNPSNFGITVTLLLFPHVGLAPPYQFTEGMLGAGDWVLPAAIICTGSFLNTRFTQRMPLIAGWLGGFVLQATVRSLMNGTPWTAGLGPMTGVAFILYTFYMVSDPGTTPGRPKMQALFGLGVAVAYGLFVQAHIVYDLFLSLTTVCMLRGGYHHLLALLARRAEPAPVAAAASLGGEPRP